MYGNYPHFMKFPAGFGGESAGLGGGTCPGGQGGRKGRCWAEGGRLCLPGAVQPVPECAAGWGARVRSRGDVSLQPEGWGQPKDSV